MNETKVIYTPIDAPPQPKVDAEKLKHWLRDFYKASDKYRNFLTKDRHTGIGLVENYPWDLTVVFYDLYETGPGWVTPSGWNKTFKDDWPELAEWMPKAFGLEWEDIGLVTFLPVRDEHGGVGFWHNDPEWHGLRFYVDYPMESKNKLFIRRTKRFNKTRAHYEYPMDLEKYLQPEQMTCKVLSANQVFFLNNTLSAHATYTEELGLTRIACIVASKPSTKQKVTEKVVPLIERSAEKFKDYSLYWKDESQD